MFKPRWWLFWFGLVLLALALWLTLTPTLWILEGRPNESYPELFVAAFGIPAAVVVTLVGLGTGVFLNRRKRKKDRHHG